MKEEVIIKAAKKYEKSTEFGDIVLRAKGVNSAAGIGFLEGAVWMQEQFEKNRLSACNAQTEEEAQREMGFAISIIENEHRQPTFSDAIEYGMKLQKEKMIDKACEWLENEIPFYLYNDGEIDDNLLDDFRKSMEEGR